jgi:rubrerythrin
MAHQLADLENAQTFQNLKQAFAADCQAAARYRAFASRADLNGQVEAAKALLAVARGKELQAEQQLDFLRNVVDPQTGAKFGTCELDLRSALERAIYESETFFPGLAKTAREEGFDQVGVWFEAQAEAARHQAACFRRALVAVEESHADEARAEG